MLIVIYDTDHKYNQTMNQYDFGPFNLVFHSSNKCMWFPFCGLFVCLSHPRVAFVACVALIAQGIGQANFEVYFCAQFGKTVKKLKLEKMPFVFTFYGNFT